MVASAPSGDLARLLQRFFRKQPGKDADHFVELAGEYAACFLA